jgi:hypothetical protein
MNGWREPPGQPDGLLPPHTSLRFVLGRLLPPYSAPPKVRHNRVGSGDYPPPPTPPDMRARIRRFTKYSANVRKSD